MAEENSLELEDISGRLTRQYILALTAIAVFALLAQALVQHMLNTSVSDARIVNILGRQRMFSQRICKTILILHHDTSGKQNQYYINELDSISNLWKNTHEAFKSRLIRDQGQEYHVNMSDSLRWQLREVDIAFANLHSVVKEFRASIRTDTQLVSRDSIRNAALNSVLLYERSFVKQQDRLVYRYDLEAKRRLEKLKYSELTLLALTIMVLIMEGLFIYRPAVLYIRKIIDMLLTSRKSAYAMNEELSNVNESLRKAEMDLVTAEKEKYQIQYNEHKIRSASIIEGQEDERKRIAKELHDGLGQLLTTLKLKLDRIQDKTLPAEKELLAYEEAKKLLADTIAEVRNISFNLMPSVLSDFGVSSALRILTEQVSKNTGMDVSFRTNTPRDRYHLNIEVGLYRIAQEAIHNAIKHSNAAKIRVVLEKNPGILELYITDNGIGMIPKSSQKNGNGIFNMQERTELIGGTFKVLTKPNKGTRVYVCIPID